VRFSEEYVGIFNELYQSFFNDLAHKQEVILLSFRHLSAADSILEEAPKIGNRVGYFQKSVAKPLALQHQKRLLGFFHLQSSPLQLGNFRC